MSNILICNQYKIVNRVFPLFFPIISEIWHVTDTYSTSGYGHFKCSPVIGGYHPEGVCLVAQSCQILCDPMDCSLPDSSVHGDSPGKNTGVGCHSHLQGIFPIQGSNLCLLHCRRILYHLSQEQEHRWCEIIVLKHHFMSQSQSAVHMECHHCNARLCCVSH